MSASRYRAAASSVAIGVSLAIAAFGPPAMATDRAVQPAPDAAPYRAPEAGGPRRLLLRAGAEVILRRSADAASTAVATLDDGAVLSNLGCDVIDGLTWCAVRPFRGGARGYVRAVDLAPAAGPDGRVAVGPNDSRRRALRRAFDAEGTVDCAQEAGEALGTCRAGVARAGGGDATVRVTFANGFNRRLFFVHGEFVSASATMSGAGRDTAWQLANGIHVIRVDDQRYVLPDSLVFGPR